MLRLAFSFDGKIIPSRFPLGVLKVEGGGKPQYFPPLCLQCSLLCMIKGASHLILTFHLVSSPRISAMHLCCSNNKCLPLSEMPCSSTPVPLHMASHLLPMPFPLPFLGSLPYRRLLLRLNPSPAPAWGYPHPTTCTFSVSLWSYICNL